MRWGTLAFLAAMLVLGRSPADATEKRIALVIGNGAYQHVAVLNNPTSDASAVGTVLAQAGFDVTNAADLSLADMRARIQEFSDKFVSTGSDTVAFVFFAGRGANVNGEVFLIPVDARIESASDLSPRAISVTAMLNSLVPKSRQIAIVIIDASRSNPFPSEGTSHRLSIIDAPNDTIVAFATAPGSDALEGGNTTSPYTTALVEAMKEPGLQIEQVFKKVRTAVHRATDGRQTPWESSSLTHDFVFFPVKP